MRHTLLLALCLMPPLYAGDNWMEKVVPTAMLGLLGAFGIHNHYAGQAETIQHEIDTLQETVEKKDHLLHTLAEKGFVAQKGEHVVICDPRTESLRRMLLKNDIPAMEIMLRYTPDLDIDGRDKHGKCAIHVAAQTGNNDAISFLIAHKASVDMRDEDGQTPLIIATRNGNRLTIAHLLDHKADRTITDINGMTPLHHAAAACAPNIIQIILAECPDGQTFINLIDKAGKTALIHAIDRAHKPTIQLLLAMQADPNIQDIRGMTPLHYAAQKGNISLMTTLIAAGADINAQNREEQTPLMLALLAHKKPVVQFILSLNRIHNKGKQREEVEYTAHHISALQMCMAITEPAEREKATDMLLSTLTERSALGTAASSSSSSDSSGACASSSSSSSSPLTSSRGPLLVAADDCGICYEHFEPVKPRWVFSCCSKMICCACETKINLPAADRKPCPWCKDKEFVLLETKVKSPEAKSLAVED